MRLERGSIVRPEDVLGSKNGAHVMRNQRGCLEGEGAGMLARIRMLHPTPQAHIQLNGWSPGSGTI